ncbi:host cell division inhibitor Icd-like protein [Mannheimia sp. AT1]|uniref:Host cell division inhibitor Icd-like protein n=1 Tax=Mannheimia cairinae TaxID=3025936 RepID=A0ABT5MP64_9PAST|nr:host cell division inhibitor Icd-like protein [Mannheimia cairinae]MDD0823880.1 host cell division inhibitor Icd-like protein [Mannheimia cairinae]MDD0825196.1 host cell division inhibitor Icd-like protein [Mannheimia cairinae]
MKSYQTYFRTNINFVHYKQSIIEFFSLNKWLLQIYALVVVAKSTTEPENSNNLYTANSSTPLTRAFFVRSTRTPKENRMQIRIVAFLSMVACNGKGSPFAVSRVSQFLSPLHVTAQTLRSLAVAPTIYTELLAMIYKFLCLNRTKHTYNQETLYIQADSEEQARLQLSADYRLLLDRPIAKFRANQTACQTPEQNNRLPNAGGCGYDESTTKTVTGNRTRKICDFFVSRIQQNHGNTTPEIYSEFAVRLISRDKPSNWTNKASRVTAVVETVSHLLAIYPFNHSLKTVTNMKNLTQSPSGNTAKSLYSVILTHKDGSTFDCAVNVSLDRANQIKAEIEQRKARNAFGFHDLEAITITSEKGGLYA